MNLKQKINLLEKLKEERDTKDQILLFGVKPKFITKPITRWGVKIKKQNKVIKDKKHEKHNYLCRINDDQWIDLMKIKSLDKRSFNSLIQEGCRLVVQEKLGIISKQRKQRNSLNNMFVKIMKFYLILFL